MSTNVVLSAARRIAGVERAAGETVTLADGLADELVSQRLASYELGRRLQWINVPSIFRLRLTGTGVCTVDARDRLGNITTAVAQYNVTGATNQIEFPFVGEAAVEIRLNLTGTCNAEVI